MAVFNTIKKYISFNRSPSQEVGKGLSDLDRIKNYMRPGDDDRYLELNRALGWATSDQQVTPYDLYQLSIYSDILENVFFTLKNEMFRNGFEYKSLTSYDNDLQWKKLEELQKRANYNNQSLLEVFKEIESDLNVQDNAYLLAMKDYFVNPGNEIIGGEVKEILRLNPLSVEMLFDSTSRLGYNDKDQPVYFDPENRMELLDKPVNKEGRKNMRACYKVRSSKGKFNYYDTSEIIHVSKYRPSKTYGLSPLYALYNKVLTLINMDYYMRQYYSGNKVPKGMLVVNTSNADSFNSWWDKFIEKIKKNPHSINPLIHQSGEGKEPVKWVDFMRNLQEMQYTDVRNEIRTQIGAVYNVAPIFQNDVSTGGGLNNEGLQITVTNRGIEMGQSIYNDKIIPWILKQMGITDYKLTLLPSEEKDQLAEKELRLKDLQIAKQTAELGIEVKLNETGEFSYSPGKVELQSTQPNMGELFNLGKSLDQEEITKSDKIPKKKVKEIENALVNELEKLLQRFDTKTRPTTAELNKKINETVKEFDKVVKTKSSAKLKAIYRKAMKDLGKDIGEDFTLTQADKNVIEALKRDPIYQDTFKDLSDDLSKNLKEAVKTSFQDPAGFSINKLVEEMKEVAETTENRLRTIARTETTKISTASRRVQYEKTGATYKYFHIGPNDNRTTNMSKEVVKLTKNGVTWDDYVDIIDKVSKKYNPKWSVNKLAPITHPNTRHIFVARRV